MKKEIGDATFYHFTSRFHIKKCLKFGITKGILTRFIDNKFVLHKNCQWLTTNSDPVAQSWNTQINIKYDRCEYRIKLKIPKKHINKLINWNNYSKNKKEYDCLNSFKGKEDWFIYLGPIPTGWFKKTEKVGKAL